VKLNSTREFETAVAMEFQEVTSPMKDILAHLTPTVVTEVPVGHRFWMVPVATAMTVLAKEAPVTFVVISKQPEDIQR